MSMHRAILSALLLGLLSVPGMGVAADEHAAVVDDTPDHVGAPTVVIGVSASAIVPPNTRARTDQALAWLSFTHRPVTVSFEAKVADQMRCEKPSAFEIEDGRLTATMKDGGFASFCKLRFGEYTYEVVIGEPGGSERKLAGVITIE